MKFVSLGSGSKGNATLISNGKTFILIDCGFSAKEAVSRLAAKGVSPSHLNAIFVTHEHGDHSKGVATLAKKYSIPAYMTHGTARGMKLMRYQYKAIYESQSCYVDDIAVQVIGVPHDSLQASQFIFSHAHLRLGILTDLGHVTEHIKQMYNACDALLLEFNHDPKLLAKGPYPPSLKKRVAGQFGHLNNQQAADLLSTMDLKRLKKLAISHVSEQNNCKQLALSVAQQVLDDHDVEIHTLEQSHGCHWLELA